MAFATCLGGATGFVAEYLGNLPGVDDEKVLDVALAPAAGVGKLVEDAWAKLAQDSGNAGQKIVGGYVDRLDKEGE